MCWPMSETVVIDQPKLLELTIIDLMRDTGVRNGLFYQL